MRWRYAILFTLCMLLVPSLLLGLGRPVRARTIMVFQQGDSIYTLNADGGSPRRITRGHHDCCPAVSPRGDRIAFIRDNEAIHIMYVDGSRVRKLAGTSAAYPSWSPDGKHIAYVNSDSNKIEERGIWVINADGSHLRQVVRDDSGISSSEPLSWSKRNNTILVSRGYLYTYSRGNREDRSWAEIRTASVKTGKERVVIARVEGDAPCPTWSPDGKKIAYISRSDGKGDVYIRTLSGTKSRRVTFVESVNSFAWSPDGRQIAYASTGGRHISLIGVTNIHATNRATSQIWREQNIFGGIFRLTWAPRSIK